MREEDMLLVRPGHRLRDVALVVGYLTVAVLVVGFMVALLAGWYEHLH